MRKDKLRILIVDDNPVFVSNFTNLIKDILGDRLMLIDKADCGEEGLLYLNMNRYDFVFADIDMPGIGGISMTKNFDRDNYRSGTKIIAISFHNELEYFSQMLSAGASKYLAKDEIDFNSVSRIFENH
jgi:DNA-binding NarL/FixJ family response regulator